MKNVSYDDRVVWSTGARDEGVVVRGVPDLGYPIRVKTGYIFHADQP